MRALGPARRGTPTLQLRPSSDTHAYRITRPIMWVRVWCVCGVRGEGRKVELECESVRGRWVWCEGGFRVRGKGGCVRPRTVLHVRNHGCVKVNVIWGQKEGRHDLSVPHIFSCVYVRACEEERECLCACAWGKRRKGEGCWGAMNSRPSIWFVRKNSRTSFLVAFIMVIGDSLSRRILVGTDPYMAKFTVLPSHHIFFPFKRFSLPLMSRTYVIASSYGFIWTPAADKWAPTVSDILQSSMNKVAESERFLVRH